MSEDKSEAQNVHSLDKARSALKRGKQSDWPDGLIYRANGSIDKNISNCQVILDAELQGRVRFDEFAQRIVLMDGREVREIDDSDISRFRIENTRKYGVDFGEFDTSSALHLVAQANKTHPVKDYLNALVWDGRQRVAFWLQNYLGVYSRAGTPEEQSRYMQYVAKVGTKWLVSAVARVIQPPVKADCVLILEGPQGVGKSTAVAILAGPWFSDSPMVLGEKDSFQQMQGVWIVEIAELDSFNKADSSRAKMFFGSTVDRYRPSYGRRAQNFPRQCVFVGTTNQDQYLKDPTGNRRYWPVYCTKLDAPQLRRDRDQLWAEAVHLYRQGVPWWVEEDEAELFSGEQDRRATSDAWEDLILDWLRDPSNHNAESVYTTAQLMEGALKLQPHQMRQPEQVRVGMIMSRLGWIKSKRTLTTSSGKKERKNVYEMPPGWLKSS